MRERRRQAAAFLLERESAEQSATDGKEGAEMFDAKQLGRELKRQREAQGRRVEELAAACGYREEWERGQCAPTLEELYQTAGLLGVAPEALLEGQAAYAGRYGHGGDGIPNQDPRCYYQDVEIRFSECDSHKEARIETLLQIMADMAGVAYAAKGYTHAWLWEHQSVFLVTRASIRIRRAPQADERITVETWEVGIKGAQYYRDFRFYDRKGTPIVEGQTAWVVVDPETRAIQKPWAFPGKFDPIPNRVADTLPPARLRPEEEYRPAGTRTVVYSDIDGNGHTYNARYAGMACDVLPAEIWSRRLTDFRINFKQEARLGETLALGLCRTDGKASVIGMLGDTVSFEAEFLFDGAETDPVCGG